jgi:ABC-2 type transport system permease protein
MVVPSLMIVGEMGALGLVASMALSVLGTIGLVLVAARVYERAVLRIGAPVKLRQVLGGRRPGREVARLGEDGGQRV